MSIDTLRQITVSAEAEFGGLNNVQLNWKSGTGNWSIAQVLEHVILSNRRYVEKLLPVLSDKYRPTLWEKMNPFIEYTGKNLVKNLGPEVIKKYTAPMLFTPSKKMIGQEIVGHFLKMQKEIIDLFAQLQKNNFTDRVISSPVASLVTLKVSDVIKLVTAHEQRHLNQALKIKATAGFPE
jgi:hypothetical protein